MKKVTNNQYQEILKDEASKYWEKVFAIDKSTPKEKIIELKKQYEQEMDDNISQYEIIPFSTSNEELTRIVNKFCSSSTEEENSILYRGFTQNDYILYKELSKFEGFGDVSNSCYQQAYYLDNELITATYTEGDISIEVFNNKESYLEGKEKFVNWYKENC